MPEIDRGGAVREFLAEVAGTVLRHRNGCQGTLEDCEDCGGIEVYGVLCSWLAAPNAALAELQMSSMNFAEGGAGINPSS
jgi:hypothetical protein